MKQITSTRFRRTYLAESEPVEVKAHDKTIGFWYPAGSEPFSVTSDGGPETVTEADVRFTIRPTHGPKPEMVATVKPIFDPLEMRKQEQVRADEFQARTFGRKKA